MKDHMFWWSGLRFWEQFKGELVCGGCQTGQLKKASLLPAKGGAVLAGVVHHGHSGGAQPPNVWWPCSLGSLSEMFLQYLVSSHSLPPFSSILRFPAFKHIQLQLMFEEFRPSFVLKAQVRSVSFTDPVAFIYPLQGPPKPSGLWSGYSTKTALADFTHDCL